jgi:hypothetical protein
MTQDEIIEMAKPYEWLGAEGWTFNHYWQLEAFVKLVAAKAWAAGYQQGVEDERISENNIGIAGFGMKVEPARENPYAIRARGEA